jgi:hypothetical protein
MKSGKQKTSVGDTIFPYECSRQRNVSGLRRPTETTTPESQLPSVCSLIFILFALFKITLVDP